MSESEEIRLWCWVLGDAHKRVFSVIIKRSARIGDLQKAIKEQKPSFKDIPADSIDLYKLKIQLPLQDFTVNDALGINLEDSRKLVSSKDVSFYWTKEPGKVLSVISQRPAGTTITPSPFENSLNSPPPWLVEIHSQLWGQRDFLGKIFRTATVTKGDYTELQDLLDELNPERNSDEYESKDVLATKSTFLRGKGVGLDRYLVDGLVPRPVLGPCQPPSSGVVDEGGVVGDNDVVDGGDVVMDNDDAAMVVDNTHLPNETTAIFPYTFQYMDLTILRGNDDLRVPPLMLFRNEWGTMIDIFNEREKGRKGSAVFSGQPGIGKTCMLYSILVLCIILARPIVFQDMYGRVFMIGTTVRPLGRQGVYGDADDVLALVDADIVCQPNEHLFDGKYRILLTSSPRKREDRRWLKQLVGPNAMFMADPWSREELIITSLFLESDDITLKQLQEASRICGNVPRECFAAAVSPLALWAAKETIKNAIRGTTELSDAINNMRVGGETMIHDVCQIRPLYKERLWISCRVEPVSDWAFSEMMNVLDKRRPGSVYEFFRAIKGCSDGAVLAGRSFEYCIHKFLKNSSQTFTIEPLDDHSATL